MKHQTVLPNRIPSSKTASQEGKKDTHNLLTRLLVVILVVTFAFAAFFTARSLPWQSILSRLNGDSRSFPVAYDAAAARDAAIVLPGQVARLAVKSPYYDATAARNSAIILPGQAERTAFKRSYYDATAARNSAIVLPDQVTRLAGTGSYYDATAAMQNAIVYP